MKISNRLTEMARPKNLLTTFITRLTPCSKIVPKKIKAQTIREKRMLREKLSGLPDTSIFPSNHVMVNKERIQYNLPLLIRKKSLDEIARSHAKLMMEQQKIIPCLNEECMLQLRQSLHPASHFGVNVKRGYNTVREIHQKFMKSKIPKLNILDRTYENMGFGTAQDKTGQLYVCQIFTCPEQAIHSD